MAEPGGRPLLAAGRAAWITRLAAVLLLAASCATPVQRFDREASDAGLVRRVVTGERFRHAVYLNAAAAERIERGDPGRIHVYLAGDVAPARVARLSRSADVAPWPPVALRLLALDPAPALLLGRPGHHGETGASAFDLSLGRYGEDVVESGVAALSRLLGPERPVTLIGFSGGGTLAFLMAERMSTADELVTVAANLSVAAWAGDHGFLPLRGSLDPATEPPLGAGVHQWHLLALQDDVVPPSLVEPVLGREPSARILRFADFDHACCWTQVWLAVLSDIRRAPGPPRPALP